MFFVQVRLLSSFFIFMSFFFSFYSSSPLPSFFQLKRSGVLSSFFFFAPKGRGEQRQSHRAHLLSLLLLLAMEFHAEPESLDEIDEETLQTLFLHLGSGKPTSTAQVAVESSMNANEDPAIPPTSGDHVPDPPPGSVQLSSGGSSAANSATAALASAVDVEAIPDYALPDAQFIERTILPLLLRGLEEVARVRPPDPLAFLGAYLISNNPQKPTMGSPVVVVPGAATSTSLTPDGGQCGTTTHPTPQSSLLPTDQPALADAVRRAAARFEPHAAETSAG